MIEPVWILGGVAAIIIGISKTSFGGLGSVAVALLAFTMPTKESTAAALLLLITGDVIAVFRYRKNADWRLLRALLPAVLPGLLLGAGFIRLVDDTVLRRSIGVMLGASVLVQLLLTWAGKANQRKDDAPPPRALSIGAGVAAGFTTMTANAAGPVMALYLQLARVEKMRFLGTSAWFYGLVNAAKTPLTAYLGLFTPRVLHTALVLVPLVLVGAAIGMKLIHKVDQRFFDVFTLLTSIASAVVLVVV
ncbi:TSUP family transporter [Brooklawnia cerclae]|uniref:Probable membrane transporter protein n=1 Tax=Brooklawnia cerclae TaxID=349934 RepID=A0ABX0SIM8_9ACTN|nr:hypothetical protein [Brooklawnia cerclae]